MSRLQEKFHNELAAEIQQKLGLGNVHEIPRIEKVGLNSGFGNVEDRKQACEDAIRTGASGEEVLQLLTALCERMLELST